MMELSLRPATPDEQKYTFTQEKQLQMQCGSVGHLRGDFDSDGTSFFTTWQDHVFNYKTDEFLAEFDDVIKALHNEEQFGGILKDRTAMHLYCDHNPQSVIPLEKPKAYAFRADTQNFAYLIRCCPAKGGYNFYVYPYVAKWLDKHIERANQGIRFIDPSYKEKFTLEDGKSIVVTRDNGQKDTRPCRFIDETHVSIGGNLYHICEYAEMLERNGSTCEPAETNDKAADKAKPKKPPERESR